MVLAHAGSMPLQGRKLMKEHSHRCQSFQNPVVHEWTHVHDGAHPQSQRHPVHCSTCVNARQTFLDELHRLWDYDPSEDDS